MLMCVPTTRQAYGIPYLHSVSHVVVVVSDELRLKIDVDTLPLLLQPHELRPVDVVDAVHRARQDGAGDLSS